MTLERPLLPCPFCGGEPRITRRQDEDLWTHNSVEWVGVWCMECSIGFDWPPGAEPDAIDQWNTRAINGEDQKLEPHAYAPSAMHMGDCTVCGHLQGAPIHSPFLRRGAIVDGEEQKR